jgi:plasmid stabilization system protein ParE
VTSGSIRFHPLAADEAEAARVWYLARNPTVAAAFSRELIAAIEIIAEAPSRWPRLYDRFRRYLLHRFPFSVVYLEQKDGIEVIAVAHHRRKPGYWKQR